MILLSFGRQYVWYNIIPYRFLNVFSTLANFLHVYIIISYYTWQSVESCRRLTTQPIIYQFRRECIRCVMHCYHSGYAVYQLSSLCSILYSCTMHILYTNAVERGEYKIINLIDKAKPCWSSWCEWWTSHALQ